MIKPWIFEFFGAPIEFHAKFDASKSARYFDAYLDLWASAEPAGFEGIFFSEHHFGAAYSPAPNLLIASVATRTKTLRLGTLGMVPPYHTPWQLIEEIGMLDHLTGGRLEIGTAAGRGHTARPLAWRRRRSRQPGSDNTRTCLYLLRSGRSPVRDRPAPLQPRFTQLIIAK